MSVVWGLMRGMRGPGILDLAGPSSHTNLHEGLHPTPPQWTCPHGCHEQGHVVTLMFWPWPHPRSLHLMIPPACCCQGGGCRVSGPKPAGSERVSSPSTRRSGCSIHSCSAPHYPPPFPLWLWASDSEKTTDHWNRIEAILFSASSIIHNMFIVLILFILLIVVLFSLFYCTFIYLFLDHFGVF